MSKTIDGLFDAYEQGQLSRRQLLAAIASFVALSGSTTSTAAHAADRKVAPDHGGDSAEVSSDDPRITRRVTGEGRTHINHINLRVRDIDRSFAFYQRFFGLGIVTTPTYNALDCGEGTFISLQTKELIDLELFRHDAASGEWAKTPHQPPGIIEHFCLEVDDFDSEKTVAELRAAGHSAIEIFGNVMTADPDGILVQVIDSKKKFMHEFEPRS